MSFDLTTKNDNDDIIIEESVDENPGTILKALEAELKREVRLDPITLTVPNRPGMTIRFDTNIESGTIQMWRKQSQNKSMADNFDGLKFSSLVIANKAEAVLYNSVVARTEDGDELNFKNPALLSMLGATRALDAVRKLYGADGHIFVAADEILRAAGYDSEGQEQQTDPTFVS
jgi:hypothetical protein